MKDYIKEQNNYLINKPIRLIELFGGIGSQAKALKNISADFEHYRLVEIDKYAVMSYNAIHGTDFKTQDIKEVSADSLGITDVDKYCYIMSYSFPCVDLSICGKKLGMSKDNTTRSGLLWEVERILSECSELPQVLLMENVTLVHGKKNMADFKKWIEFLESKGYSNYWQDLSAMDYGIPQTRTRCFMVSILGDYSYEFPKPVELKLKLSDMLDKEVDPSFNLSEVAMRGMLNSGYHVRNTTIQTNDYCCTLAARDYKEPKCVPIDSSKQLYRKLTPLEYFRLMGFDDIDYKNASKVNSKTQLYKQCGNSIVVKVLEAILKQMF